MSPSSWIAVAAVVLVASPAVWWALEDFILDRVALPAPAAGRRRAAGRGR
jgi:hypothetical protein